MKRFVIYLSLVFGASMGCDRCEGEVVDAGPYTRYTACETSTQCGEDAPLCETFTITDADGGVGDYSWCTKECEYPSACNVSFGLETTGITGECYGIDGDGGLIYYSETDAGYCFELCYYGDPTFGPWNCSQIDAECLLIQETTPSYNDDGTLFNDGMTGVCVPPQSSSGLDGGMNE